MRCIKLVNPLLPRRPFRSVFTLSAFVYYVAAAGKTKMQFRDDLRPTAAAAAAAAAAVLIKILHDDAAAKHFL